MHIERKSNLWDLHDRIWNGTDVGDIAWNPSHAPSEDLTTIPQVPASESTELLLGPLQPQEHCESPGWWVSLSALTDRKLRAHFQPTLEDWGGPAW